MIGIIVQARMSSTRLPGKVTKLLCEKPMMQVQLERLLTSKNKNKLIVATSDCDSDQVIAELCLKLEVDCFRGDLNDVLSRFYHCAKQQKLTHIVRICGDCPLIDPELVDSIIEYHLKSKADYTSNCIKRCFPDGQDIEIFSFSALESAYLNAQKPSQREHVTPYIRDCGNFTCANYTISADYSALRICVDQAEDFAVIEQVYKNLKSTNFGYEEIVKYLLANPQVTALNADIKLNEGYKKSLQQDKQQGF